MNLKPDKDGTKVGLIAGLISSLCCITPAAILLMGIGGTSFALSFIGLKPYFLIISILFLLAAFWWNKRKKQCDLKTSLKSSFTVSAVLIHVVIFVFAFYFLLPYVSSTFLDKDSPEPDAAVSDACSIQVQLKETLGCSTCAATLEKHLSAIEGVSAVNLNSVSLQILVKYDNEKAQSGKILEALPKTLQIEGHQTSC